MSEIWTVVCSVSDTSGACNSNKSGGISDITQKFLKVEQKIGVPDISGRTLFVTCVFATCVFAVRFCHLWIFANCNFVTDFFRLAFCDLRFCHIQFCHLHFCSAITSHPILHRPTTCNIRCQDVKTGSNGKQKWRCIFWNRKCRVRLPFGRKKRLWSWLW